MEAQQHLSMRVYGHAILKRWKVVLAFTLLGLAIGLLMYLTATKAFVATSEVLIEKQSGYSIAGMGASVLGSGLNAGASTSTKQATHFLETGNYQAIARALTDLATPTATFEKPRVQIDLQDFATLDDIGTVVQKDILDSEYVTPVRLALYNLPSPSLLSFQQAKVLKAAPDLGKQLDTLAGLAVSGDFRLTQTKDWERARPGHFDWVVRRKLDRVVSSPLMERLRASLGITGEAAEQLTNTPDEIAAEDSGSLTSSGPGEYSRVVLAAQTIGTLARLDRASRWPKETKSDIEVARKPEPDWVTQRAAEIMTSHFVGTLDESLHNLNWAALHPDEKLAAIQKAGDALNAWRAKHQDKSELVWDVSGKELGDQTDIISISQAAPTADQARMAANAMAAVMVWQDRMSKIANDERSVRFLRAQIGDDNSGASKILRIREDRLAEYQSKNLLVDSVTQLKAAAEEWASLDSDRGKALVEVSDAQASLKKVLQELGASRQFVIAPNYKLNAVREGIRTDIIKTETDLAGLRAQGFTDAWPAVMSAKAELDNLKRRLLVQERDSIERQFTPDTVHAGLAGKAAELAATIVGLQARQTALGRLVGNMNNKFAALPDKEAQMLRLMRAQTLAEREYEYLNERLIDAKSNRVIRQGNARVISVATAPGEKVAPRLRNVGVAALVGLFLGCICALVLSATDVFIRTTDDVRKELSVPVLAHLPTLPVGNTLVVEAMPASAVTEAFRGLRSSIRFLSTASPIRSLSVTSVRMADTKSAVVANLSASLAQAGLVITAVDADLRSPRLDGYFGSAPGPGLSEVLAGGSPVSSARRSTRIPGLYSISAGTPPVNAAELLESGHIGDVLAGLGEGNDMVVVDTPPVGAISDAAIIGAASDATLLVIEAGLVAPDAARSAIARLSQSTTAKVIGVVLVGGDAPILTDYTQYARTVTNSVNAQGRGKA